MPSLTRPAIDAPETRGTRRSRSNTRLLIVFLVGSVAVHAAALVALPGFLPDDGDITPVRVLEAALVQAESPPQMIKEPPAPPPPPRRRPERVAKTPLLPQSPQVAEVPAPVLALPDSRTQAEPSFTVPSPQPAETRPAPAEPKTEVASIAVTPPSFGAAYLRNPAPPYPAAAQRNGVQGTVTLKVLVTRDGFPSRVELEKSSGSTPLDQAALETVKTWRFVPARRGSEAIEDTVIVPIVFRLTRAS
jgi:periplasmic protein TonB